MSPGPPAKVGFAARHRAARAGEGGKAEVEEERDLFSWLSCGATSPPSFSTDGASIKFGNTFFNRTFTSAPSRAIKAIIAELSKELAARQ